MSWPPLEDEVAWRELVAWRHPEFNLNHLQIALLQKDFATGLALWNEYFLREELYRDENGILVNHPLHLYEILDIYPSDETINGNYPSVNHINDELFYEEGLIDLTMARLRRKPSRSSQGQSDRDTSPSTTRPGQSGTQDLPPEDDLRKILQIHRKVKIADYPQPIRLQPFSKDGDKRFRPGRHLAQVVDKLFGPKGQLSTAELLCSMIGNLADFTLKDQLVFYLNFVSVPNEYSRDVLILQCQIVCAFEDGDSYDEPLSASFSQTYCLDEITEGVRYLPRYWIEDYLEMDMDEEDMDEEDMDEEDMDEDRNNLALTVLRDRLQNWTPQDDRMMDIMKMVGGDARKVWSLEYLPVPKELFHIPFGKRCEELKKRHEEREAEEQE